MSPSNPDGVDRFDAYDDVWVWDGLLFSGHRPSSATDHITAICLIHQQGVPVTTQAFVGYLRVAPPSATEMIKRLADCGLVTHTPYRPVTLTPSGARRALEFIERYSLIVAFLRATIGCSDEAISDDADRIEHGVSSELLARFSKYLSGTEATRGRLVGGG